MIKFITIHFTYMFVIVHLMLKKFNGTTIIISINEAISFFRTI